VPRDVIWGNCGAGQDELARARAVVDCPADVVPDRRLDLPLVEEPWRRTVEHERRIDLDRRSGVTVDIEQDLTRSYLPGGGRLATRPWPLDHDGANGTQASNELAIYDPRLISDGENANIIAGRKRRTQRGLRKTSKGLSPHSAR